MKVLIFSLAYHPFIGGAEVAIKEITDRLPDIRFDMVTVNLDGKQKAEEKIGNINIHRIGKGKFSKYFFPFSAKKYAERFYKEKKYDAVWSIMANQAGLAAYFFKKKNPNIPFLLTLQEGDSEFDIWLRTFYMRHLYKNIYRSADYIQAISNFLSERAKKMGAKCPVEVVPNGVDLERTKNYESDSVNKDINRYKNHEEEKIIITASRLVRKNGIDTLIRTIKILIDDQRNIPVKLVILGRGRDEKKYKALTQRLGIEDRVIFEGHVLPNIIYNRLRQGDIFVRPSRSEGLGNAFLEAMSVGVPVIGTPVGGIPDFLKDRETGLFCKVDDPRDLAEKIAFLLEDVNLYRKLSENGKKLVFEKYDWRGITQKMDKIFLKIIHKTQ